jgi:protein-S-isoprenylcysteine O-methyltransferase Ste14
MDTWERIGALAELSWAVVAAVWVIGAAQTYRHGPRVVRRSRQWLLISVAVVVIVVLSHRVLKGSVWRMVTLHDPAVIAAGIVVLLAGTALTLWARWELGSMWTGTPTIKSDHELRTDGPYAITRHPIYTGLLTMLIGTMMISGYGPWPLVLVLTVLLVEFKIHAEEKLLTEEFPLAYPAYRNAVPQLVPLPRHQRSLSR